MKNGCVRLESCGVGEKRAEQYCRRLAPGAISNLVLVGWAGGISSNLRVGDIIVAQTAIRERKPPVSCRVLPVDRAFTGTILTSRKALSTMEEKRVAQGTGAQAVDMEGYALAEWAAAQGIPFVHVRVILDSYCDPLPSIHNRVFQNLYLSYHLFRLIRRVDPVLMRLAQNVAMLLTAEQETIARGGSKP